MNSATPAARGLLVAFVLLASSAVASAREFSIDLWDWTQSCRDLPTFKTWAADMKKVGVTRVEISAPWNLLEPEPGKYDLSFIADRLAVVKSHGMGLRVRLNSFFYAVPAWLKADMWRDAKGNPPGATPQPVSIADERFWSHWTPLLTAIGQRFKGEDILYSPFIGVHAELKYGDWWTYDPASLALWRKTIDSRPEWLIDVVGDAPLPNVPPVPQDTNGTPDNTPASKAFIAFREHVWREAMRRCGDALRAGDPNAKTSAPLGESYRRESAKMSNLDYFGLSRGASQVVHSYDFFWHPKDDAWMAAASVAAFQGITQLPVQFEFDGPALTENLGYTESQLLELTDATIAEGAGIKLANFSYGTKLPSEWSLVHKYGQRVASAKPQAAEAREKTVLLFISKWANYCYREKSEWLHDAQFGAWRMLTSLGVPVRFICEDNLTEDLSGYRGVYVAFSPPELLPASSRPKLDALTKRLPSIIELSAAPKSPPSIKDLGSPSIDGAMLNFPLAYAWLKSDARRPELQRYLDPLLKGGAK
jgi:hypothetical protein